MSLHFSEEHLILLLLLVPAALTAANTSTDAVPTVLHETTH